MPSKGFENTENDMLSVATFTQWRSWEEKNYKFSEIYLIIFQG